MKGELLDLGITQYIIDEWGNIDVFQDVTLYKMGLTEIPIKFRNVYGSFICDRNPLKTLINSPDYVRDDLEVYECELVSLEGCTPRVDGMFECYRNFLISLEGGPKNVGHEYVCYDNMLETLKGCPPTVEFFDCSYNPLKTLEYSPRYVETYLRARHCELVSLDGLGFVSGFLDVTKNRDLVIKDSDLIKVRGKIFKGDDKPDFV